MLNVISLLSQYHSHYSSNFFLSWTSQSFCHFDKSCNGCWLNTAFLAYIIPNATRNNIKKFHIVILWMQIKKFLYLLRTYVNWIKLIKYKLYLPRCKHFLVPSKIGLTLWVAYQLNALYGSLQSPPAPEIRKNSDKDIAHGNGCVIPSVYTKFVHFM